MGDGPTASDDARFVDQQMLVDLDTVVLLSEGVISGSRYEPRDTNSVVTIAGSIRGLVAFFIERAAAAIET